MTSGRTDGRTGGQTDRKTDRQTDGRGHLVAAELDVDLALDRGVRLVDGVREREEKEREPDDEDEDEEEEPADPVLHHRLLLHAARDRVLL